MGYRYGMMGYGWGWLMMICVVVITVLGIIALIRYLQQSGKSNVQDSESNALNILNERYARGEITEDEYKNKKTQIKS